MKPKTKHPSVELVANASERSDGPAEARVGQNLLEKIKTDIIRVPPRAEIDSPLVDREIELKQQHRDQQKSEQRDQRRQQRKLEAPDRAPPGNRARWRQRRYFD